MSNLREGLYCRVLRVISLAALVTFFISFAYMSWFFLGYEDQLEPDATGQILRQILITCVYILQIAAAVRILSDILLLPVLYKQKKDISVRIVFDIIIILIEATALFFGIMFSGTPQF